MSGEDGLAGREDRETSTEDSTEEEVDRTGAGDPGAGIADRLAAVRRRIEAAAAGAGRASQEVTLVGVSKRQPAEAVVAAVAAGLRDVAESFAQEAREKIPAVNAALEARGLARPRWHFVGQLQRNKARLVAPLCDQVQSLDRPSLADELDRRASPAGRHLDVLLQVNLSDEPQKGGARPDELSALLDHVAGCRALRVRGLMTIPRGQTDPQITRATFARLRALRDDLCERREGQDLPELSMGMSADFELAIEEGATLVRVGTALFGPRPLP